MTFRSLRLAMLLAGTVLAMPAQADDLADGFNNPPSRPGRACGGTG
ncbi:hypothetical protein [Sphingobium sp. AP49]